MGLVKKTRLANRKNYGSMRTLTPGKVWLVFHYTANDGDTDEANANYFATGYRGASAHWFVDNDSATNSVPENYTAWHVGGNRYSNYKQTGGAKYYGMCKNTNSIGIEMCDCEKNGKYNFTEATLNNVVELAKEIVARYNIPRSMCIRHFDVVGKKCPAPFVDNPADFEALLDRIYSGISTTAPIVPAPSAPTSSTTLRVGDKVKVLNNRTYTGGTFKLWYDWYDVMKVNGDKITIGRGNVATCHIHKNNLVKIS